MALPENTNTKVVIISHSLVEREHLKNVSALGLIPGARVVAIVPKHCSLSLFEASTPVVRSDVRPLSSWQRGSQVLFWPPALGVRQFRPDVIQVDYPPWTAAFWQAALAARVAQPRAALICTIKKNTYRKYSGPLGWLKSVIGSLGFRIADGVEFSSEMARRAILDSFPRVRRLPTAVLTHQGVDVKHFHPKERAENDNSTFLVGYSGRIDSRDKALGVLIAAIDKCHQKLGTPINLDILGAGPDETELRGLIAEKSWIRLLPRVPMSDVPAFLRTLDLFVLPSRVRPDHEEHDAHALLQAAACGVPSIATASGINPEIVALGVGTLVEPDNVDAMAAAISSMAANRTLRLKVSKRSRLVAETHFAVGVVANRRNSFYKQVLGNLRREDGE